jgi:IS30 family transposase
MVLISERPAEAADRAVPGHWESDPILGARNASQILTLVERSTRFVLLQKIPYDRRAERVALLLGECIQRLPALLWRSITHDQGVEMANHAHVTPWSQVVTATPVLTSSSSSFSAGVLNLSVLRGRSFSRVAAASSSG